MLAWNIDALKVATYTVGDEQHRDCKEVVVVDHAKFVFHPVKSGVTNGNSIHETERSSLARTSDGWGCR